MADERTEVAQWLAARRGISFDDCDDGEQAEWRWEAEAVISKLHEYTDTDEELAMANARIKDLEAGLEHEGCDRVLHATETALATTETALAEVTAERDEWQVRAEVAEEVAADALWAHTVVEAARPNVGECVNFSPDSPYNCYEVDPKPYLTMPCLACALVIYDGAVNRA